MRKIETLISDINNERLDKFIASKINVSRTNVQRLIKDGKVKINNEVVTISKFLVYENDEINIINEVIKEETKLESVKMNLDIKYEDDYLLVINKSSGMVVHPGAGTVSPTLVNGLKYYLKNNISNKEDNIRPGIVHRLDKDTEGLLIIAKNDNSHRLLQEAIRKKEVKRYYRAIVKGTMEHKKGTIDAPIMRDPKYRQKYIVGSKNSKECITLFETIDIRKNISLVNIELKTGRTHQIRVHFKYIDHPIFNDQVYGKQDYEEDSNYGQFLQAYKLQFEHPITKKNIKIELEMPKIFNNVLNIK